jgi:hypothetical protein
MRGSIVDLLISDCNVTRGWPIPARQSKSSGSYNRSGNINITDSFNNSRGIALGSEAQVNVYADVLEKGVISDQASSTTYGSIAPLSQSLSPQMCTRSVFISYNHADLKWFTMLKTQLAILESQNILELWYDTKIVGGPPWEQAVGNVLRTAHVAVLLVSRHFLASDSIGRYELPRVLERQTKGHMSLLPLIVAPCLYQESPLGKYQPFNPVDKPLSALSSSQVENVLAQFARTIQKVLESGAG